MWKWRIESTALRPSPGERNDDLGWGLVAPYDALAVTPSAELAGPPLPGGTPAPAQAQVGRTPPLPSEDPVALRAMTAMAVTGVGVLGAGLIWFRHRGRELFRRGRRG